jgi:hypothetical protein
MELIAYFPLIQHRRHIKRKILGRGDTEREESDLMSLKNYEMTDGHGYTDRQGDLTCPLLFFQNNESRLKRVKLFLCLIKYYIMKRWRTEGIAPFFPNL